MNMFVTLAWKRSVNLVLVFSNIWQKNLANEYRLLIILYSRLEGIRFIIHYLSKNLIKENA